MELYTSHGIGFGNNQTSQNENGLHDQQKKEILDAVTEEFGAEWVGRLDAVCLFAPLTKEHMEQIIQKQVQKISDHLLQTKKIAVAIDASAIDAILQDKTIKNTGARHIERTVEQAIHEAVWSVFQKQKRKTNYTLKHKEGTYRLL